MDVGKSSSFIIVLLHSTLESPLPLVEQELHTLLEHLSSSPFLVGFLSLNLYFSVQYFINNLLFFFCPCSFLSLYYLSGELWLLITSLVCSSFSCHFTGYMEDTNRWYWQIWKFCLSHEQISLVIITCTEGTERVVNDVSNPLVDEQVTRVREVSNLIISTHPQASEES